MYDTIEGYLYIDKLKLSEKEHLVNCLSRVTELSNDFGTCYKGNFNGLVISISNSKLKMNGSISKYLLGDNISTITRQDVCRVIESLSEAFKIDFKSLLITRVDVAQNFIMKNKVELYFSRLVDLNHSQRLQFPNGIYFKKQNEVICLYDKLEECKLNRQIIYPEFKELNMLRYEYRLINRINTVLNTNRLNFFNLQDEEFYMKIIKLWHDYYFMINKQNETILKPQSTAKKLESQLASISINLLGMQTILKCIKDWQKLGLIEKKNAYDLRKKVKELSSSIQYTEKCDLITELDEKVKESILYFR